VGVDTVAGYQVALAAVVRADEAYRGGLSNDSVNSIRHAGGVNPWVPTYRDLLAELRAHLQAAGQRYDRSAEDAAIPVAERFNWHELLSNDDEPDPAAR
jgi:aryl-alcohol dehydrogenase-like predicted oxidoreductase